MGCAKCTTGVLSNLVCSSGGKSVNTSYRQALRTLNFSLKENKFDLIYSRAALMGAVLTHLYCGCAFIFKLLHAEHFRNTHYTLLYLYLISYELQQKINKCSSTLTRQDKHLAFFHVAKTFNRLYDGDIL